MDPLSKNASDAAWIIKGFLVIQPSELGLQVISALASLADAPRIVTEPKWPVQELGEDGPPAIAEVFARGKHRARVVVVRDIRFFIVFSSMKH